MPKESIDDLELVEELQSAYSRIAIEIRKTIVGQQKIVDELLIALLCGGHVLLIGVPGLAKTLLISTLSKALNLTFSRIQFTPDLMPSDIIGTEVLEEDQTTGQKSFRFVKGPLFAHILLADEINRTPPKTQAALLQAMQEHEVTAGSETFQLEEPFFVLATQNPIEQEGTYPLPEAQLDRFFFNLWIDYPSKEEENRIVKTTTGTKISEILPVITASQIIVLQRLIRNVPVSDHVIDYAVDLVRKTRPHGVDTPLYISEMVNWGAGPRASQCLILGAKARAVLKGRYTASVDDVQFVATAVLRHRLVTSFNAEAEGVTSLDLIQHLIKDTKP